jgi:Pyruvate/2-oxoacid:ferredoxin oxidoreductase delta subunit
MENKISKSVIYFFSGTGNARNVARWMKELFDKQAIATKIMAIDEPDQLIYPHELDAETLLGLCYPTHGFNAPPIVWSFLKKVLKRNHRVFLINTRGGLKLQHWFIPGLSGLALLGPSIYLISKGYRIHSLHSLDLPSNWLLLHPGLKANVVDSIYCRIKGITKTLAMKLAHGKKSWKALYSLPIDIAMIPLVLGYMLIGRYAFSKTLMATDRCNACMKCYRNCPVNAIHWVGDRPYWSVSCESCMRCVNQCPERAIETAHGWLVFWSVLLSIAVYPIIRNVYPLLSIEPAIEPYAVFILESVLYIGVLILAYRLNHFLLKFKIIQRLIRFTSLSHFKWWRRYYPKSR